MTFNLADRSPFVPARTRLAATFLVAAVLAGATACDGSDTGASNGDGGAGGDTSTGGSGGSGGGGTATSTQGSGGGASVILECGDGLSYVISCLLENPQYTVCSDYFGNHEPKAIEAQCAAGNGTPTSTPCDLQDRAGACVFFNQALSDRCYVEHVAPPTAASFWETTCPAAGGSWVPAE